MNSVHEQCPKQCIESRLGQVHSVPTPMAHVVRTLLARPAVSWRTKRHVAGLPRPYRDLQLGRVAARTCRVIGGVVRRVATRPCALLGVVSQASSVMSRARSAVSWRCLAVSCPPLGAPRHACLLSLLCADQPAACLLSLLCACSTCSVCCVPQYNLLYCDSILENEQ